MAKAKAPKIDLVVLIRNVILTNKSREYQYRDLMSTLGISRSKAKVLMFAWLYRAGHNFLQEKLDEPE